MQNVFQIVCCCFLKFTQNQSLNQSCRQLSSHDIFEKVMRCVTLKIKFGISPFFRGGLTIFHLKCLKISKMYCIGQKLFFLDLQYLLFKIFLTISNFGPISILFRLFSDQKMCLKN